MSILAGPTHVVLNWTSPTEGWTSNYTVSVIPTPEEDPNKQQGLNRTRREENMTKELIQVSTTKPPVNITRLAPESKYKFVIITKLSPDFKTTMTLEDVYTTANNSKMPEEIVGVSHKARIT